MLRTIAFVMILLSMVFLAIGCAEQIEKKEPAVDWKNTEFVDARTGDNFKISDFIGKPVLLESFAVWCPTCRKHQEKIKDLHEEIGDSFVSISIDTDPNEYASQVVDYAKKYGFDWRFAISPVEVTRALIDEFSIRVVNALSAPVILVCEVGSARLLKRGVNSADDLKSEIECC